MKITKFVLLLSVLIYAFIFILLMADGYSAAQTTDGQSVFKSIGELLLMVMILFVTGYFIQTNDQYGFKRARRRYWVVYTIYVLFAFTFITLFIYWIFSK